MRFPVIYLLQAILLLSGDNRNTIFEGDGPGGSVGLVPPSSQRGDPTVEFLGRISPLLWAGWAFRDEQPNQN